MKKLFTLILSAIILSLCILPVFALQTGYTIPDDRQFPIVFDEADVLTSSEESALSNMLNDITNRQQCEVAVAIVKSLNGKSAQSFVNDFYDYNGYGCGTNDDGILFLISMEECDWAIRTFGIAFTVFTDAGLAYITDMVAPELSNGNYSEAFTVFAEQCDMFLTDYKTSSTVYDVGNLPKSPMSASSIIIALVIGIIIAFIATAVMKGNLKSVRSQPMASNYVRQNSFRITDNRDIFLTKKISRIPIPQSTSSGRSGGGSTTHTSSAGRSGGGASGKF